MARTQIYLTVIERRALAELSRRTGRTRSDLIREAVDKALKGAGPQLALLRRGRGLWADREDLPEFMAIRREMDRPAKART